MDVCCPHCLYHGNYLDRPCGYHHWLTILEGMIKDDVRPATYRHAIRLTLTIYVQIRRGGRELDVNSRRSP